MFRSLNGSQTDLEQPSGDVGRLRLAPSTFTSEERAFGPVDSKTNAPKAPSTVDLPTGPSKWDLILKESSVHGTMLIAGWSDASSGPLIPYIQAYYGITYTVVSMLFVGQMVGFLTAAFANGPLSARFGLGKVITAGAAIQAFGFVFLVPAFPFPVMPVCYAVIGFGLALQDAQANTYIASLPNSDHKFSLLHASYGLGAVIVPLAATAFASSGIKFSYFYCISIGIALLNVGFLVSAFKFDFRVEEDRPNESDSADDIRLQDLGVAQPTASNRASITTTATSGTVTRPPTPPPEVDESVAGTASAADPSAVLKKGSSLLGETLRTKVLWLFSFFVLFYVGSEVSMGGWIVTFVQDNRSGGPSSGYIASGYWAGLLVGRLVLSWVNVRVGLKRVLFVYTALAIALEFAIMFGRNIVGNGVTVALIGVLMGPSYPLVMSIATKVIPRKLHASSIGFIAAFGQLGAAIFPFATGGLAQRFSPAALQPVMITLLGLQLALWSFVPSIDKKRD